MRTRAALLGLGAALSGLSLAGSADAARNLVTDHTPVTAGCPGYALTSTADGFLFGFGEGGGRCSLSTPWGTPVAAAAQGRMTFAAPPGARIAAWRDLDLEVVGAGDAPVQTEVYVRDATGEYQLANWGTSLGRHVATHTARHPDGASLVFLLLRNHTRFTPNPAQTRHVNVHGGTIDLWDQEAPTLDGVSVDGGGAWSAATTRVVRATVEDNLGGQGVGALRLVADGSTRVDRGAPGTGRHAVPIDVGALGDGEHTVQVVAAPAGTGDLPNATAGPLTVRLDRTPPTQPERVGGADPAWTATPSLTAEGARDTHSGVVAHEWRVSADRGATWSPPVRAAGPFSPNQDGSLKVQVRAVDAAGHSSGWTLALEEARVDRGAPSVELHAPRGGTGDGALRVRAADATSGVAQVRLERRSAGEATWTTLASGPGPELGTTVAAAGLPEGRHELRATAVDRAGNTATTHGEVTAGGAASEAASASDTPPPPAAVTSSPAPRPAPGRAILERARSLKLNAGPGVRILAGGGPRIVVRAPSRRRLRLAGRLLDAGGRPLAGTRILTRLRGRTVATTTTAADGRFGVSAPSGIGGRLEVLAGGRRVATWTVRVIPKVGVLAPRTVRAGRAWTVRGRVLPTPRAQGARRHIALLYGVDTARCPGLRHVVAAGHVFARPRPGATRRIGERCWKVVGSSRVDANGRYRIRFDDFAPLTLRGRPYPGGYRYTAYFQVRVPAGAGWTAQPGRSRTMRVTVRG